MIVSCCNKKWNVSMIKLTVKIEPLYVFHEINIIRKWISVKQSCSSSVEFSQSLKYCKNNFCIQKGNGSLMELNENELGFSYYWWPLTFFRFIWSKKVSISKQNSAVAAASGGSYFDKALLTDKLQACAAIWDSLRSIESN